MMMTEKYHTLPPPSSSPSSSSLFYHSSIRDRKARLYPSRKSTEMKLLIEPSEQQAIVRTYSSYDVQDRIDYFEKKKQFDNQCEENGKKKKKPPLSSRRTIEKKPSNISFFS